MQYLLLIILFSCSANALDYSVEVGAGMTRSVNPVNIDWYQKELPHTIKQDSPSWHMGLNFKTPHKPLSISVGYMMLGKFGIDSKATSSDDNYRGWKHKEEELWPLSTWKGRGEAKGWYIIPEYDFKHFFVRYGAWLHKASWTMEIKDWRSERTSGDDYGVDFTVYGENSRKWGRVYGIGKRFGSLTIAYDIWQVQNNRAKFPSSYHGDSQNISLSWRF